jgi:hypothetical protein
MLQKQFFIVVAFLSFLSLSAPLKAQEEKVVSSVPAAQFWFDAWDTGMMSLSKQNEFISPVFVFHPQSFMGRGDLRRDILWFHEVLPDYHQVLLDEIIAENIVIQHVSVTATYDGSYPDRMPSTVRQSTWDETHILRLKDGEIQEAWIFNNQFDVLRDLGWIAPSVFLYTRPNEVITGTTVTIDEVIEGELEVGQRVRYALTPDKDVVVNIEVTSAEPDIILHVYDANGFPMWAVDNNGSGSRGESLHNLEIADGETVLIEVGGWLDNESFSYELSVLEE